MTSGFPTQIARKELNNYRPHTRECRRCAKKNNNINRYDRNKRYYESHKQELQEKYLLSYYKKKFENINLSSLHEVNLLRISV